jgi:putative redox protein
MLINIKRVDDDYHMIAANETGNTIHMDGSTEIGGHNLAFRPTQLLLAAVGGCSVIDVIMILKKQKQKIEDIQVDVEGEREKVEDYSLFRDIRLHFKVKGEVDYDKVERAVKLSLEKYCSVAKTLEATAKINYKITVNGHEG